MTLPLRPGPPPTRPIRQTHSPAPHTPIVRRCTSLPIVADENQHTEIVQILADAILARNALADPTTIDVLTAAKAGDAVSIQRCSAAGVDVDQQDEDRRTPLMMAALYGEDRERLRALD